MFEQITRLRDTHALLMAGKCAEYISVRLGVSKSQTEKDIRTLRDIGLEVAYDRHTGVYIVYVGKDFWELIKDRVG